MPRRLQPRIGGGDDDADALLVESLEPAFALEVLQVAANGALVRELPELLLVNPSLAQQPLGALPSHGPALALGEGLLEEREIGERFHRLDVQRVELLAQ